MTKRRKRIALFVIAIPFIIVLLHFLFLSAFKKVIHADKSVNPLATDSFAHAMTIAIETKLIHDYLFVDYGSFLLNPLYLLEDHFFATGQKYISPDNIAEEAIWWSLLHMDKYDLIRGRQDKNKGLSHLSNETSLAIHDQAYKYFLIAVGTKVKGIDFGAQGFSAMSGLFIIPFYNISDTYPGKTKKERIHNYWIDYDNYQRALLSYQKYKDYIADSPYLKGKNDIVNSNIIGRLSYLIYFNYRNNHLDTACNQLLTDYLDILASPETKPDKLIAAGRIETIKVILEDVATKCPKQRNKILNVREIVNKMEEK